MLPTSNSTKSFFGWIEQCLNYKFCTRHIFSGRIGKGGKAKNRTPLKKFLQRFYNLKILYFSNISAYMDQILIKSTPKCSASKTLSVPSLLKNLDALLTL